jgi:AraC-like DNA-binding protein
MDAVSDVLRAVRLTGAVYFDIQASEPWVAETPAGPSIVGRMFPGSDQLISYHVLIRGTCWAGVFDETPMQLAPGDIIMFPHGDAHVLSSAPGMRSAPDLSLYRAPTDRQRPFTITMGAAPSEDAARFVCGFLGCDARPFNPLLAALPRMIHQSGRAGGAVAALVQFAVSESSHQRVGSEAVLGRLSELMFVDVVRRYLETLPEDRPGWFAGLRDPSIGRALAALHQHPARGWTLESLAHEVGVSRSVLAERFTELVGQPAMQYLTSWRMQLAANLLRVGESVTAVAERVGYESKAAFSRAFKKYVGTPPGEWRKHRTQAGAAGS